MRRPRLKLCCCCLLPMAQATRGPVSVAAWQREWQRLITRGAISATAVTPDGDTVRYGLRLAADGTPAEFCERADGTDVPMRNSVARIEPFALVLRANRRLRPPAAPKLGELPPHDEGACSLCTGPLRLGAREMVAQAVVDGGRCWDVHYNISPQEPTGHFLLVPEIARPANRRAQALLASDCVDLVAIGRACEGRLCVNYNSPNAGASQNHIHVHAWAMGGRYGVMDAPCAPAVRLAGGVDACVVQWPAACVLLRGGAAVEVGRALHALLGLVRTHNVAVIGETTFVFLRDAGGEVCAAVPGLKLGSPQLLGHFVVDSEAQFAAASQPGAMETALRGTRAMEPPELLLARLARRLEGEGQAPFSV
jgi:hypothetical protein